MRNIYRITCVILSACLLFAASCKQNEENDNKDSFVLEDGYYTLQASGTEKYVDGRGFTSVGARTMQWSFDERSDTQFWFLAPAKEGYYRIINLTTSLVLGIDEENGRVVQLLDENMDDRLWRIKETKEGEFMLINRLNEKALSNGGRTNDGAMLLTEDSDKGTGIVWNITRRMVFDPLASQYIKNRETGQVLKVKDNSLEYGAFLTGGEEEEVYDRQWFLKRQRDGSYYIKNLYSAKRLTGHEDGNVTLESSKDNDRYFWEIKYEQGAFILSSMEDEKVLYMEDGKVATRKSTGEENELWDILRVYYNYAVPPVNPVRSDEILVGGIAWMLWDDQGPVRWSNLYEYPERTPVLGYYNDSDPKAVDWQIKMSAESGINFFAYTWSGMMNEQGELQGRNTFWLDAYKQARYKEYMDYALFIINGTDGPFTSEEELLEVFMPYVIEEHFKDPNYVLIDGKPYLTFYRHNSFIDNLGGVEGARTAVEKMRQMCIDAGFEGLELGMAHHWGSINWMHDTIQAIGADSVYAYHVPTFGTSALNAAQQTYTDEEIIVGHNRFWQAQSASELPTVLTVSVGWDSAPWGGYTSTKSWYLHPDSFKSLLGDARDIILERKPDNRIDGRIVLLDNMAEYGEGHYLIPTEQYGFGHFNAIREVFSDSND